ncbi:Uncharacterized protein TCM_018529 [Theobroma cacao]|uniref:Putative plant transposon protein domain-containing protein n=1 Tax=Theobroma cacao TaxID=3641 RepID=A0A061EEU2_THECC|nr:Uncharacterized protein TCM_018529 [Theobroma cacao]
MTKKGHKTEKKKKKGKSFKKGNIPSFKFRNNAHENRYRKLENASITCGKYIDWDNFNEILKIQTSLLNYFEELKLKEFSTFKNRSYNANLVKEFYASITLDKDELEDSDDYIEDGLNVFLNGKEFTITAADLRNLLKIECDEGEFEFSENYDPSSLWKITIGKKEKYSSKSNVGLITSPQIRILHYFIAANIHGKSGSFSYISFQDLWLMEHAFSGVSLNLGRFMIERMKGACRLEKINLPYRNIITSLVPKKGIWSYRYEADKVKSRDQAIYLGSLPKMVYKLDEETFVKTPKVDPGKETSLHAHFEASSSQFSNEMLFNLLMRIDGKLTGQGVRMLKIEEKLAELETVLKEKGKIPSEPAVADTSVTPSLAEKQGAKGSTFQAEGHEPEVDQPKKTPSLEPQKEVESQQGTEMLGSLDENPPFPPEP